MSPPAVPSPDTAAPVVLRETGDAFGRADVRFACSCGFATDAYPLDTEWLAMDDMTGHLADVHGAEVGAGRCANCQRPTDHLRIEGGPELGTAWLCEDCAPTPAGLTAAPERTP